MSEVDTQLSLEQKRELLAKLLREKAQQETQSHALSYGQRALWFMYQLDKYSAAYNIMYAAHVCADFDRDAFCQAFQKLMDRHAVLRTTYGMKNGQAVQIVRGSQKFALDTIDVAGLHWSEVEDRIQKEADKPFDLEKGPVMRVQLLERGAEKPVLLLTAHHIAMDFWSFDILFDELELLYQEEVTGSAADLAPLKIQFSDYVRWQEEMLASAEGDKLWDYWREQLEGDLPNLDLPTDRARPPIQSFNGRSYHFKLSDGLSQQLDDLAKSVGVTKFMVLLAAFQTLLFRYSGQQEVLVGSPTAGRNRAELEQMLGYFLNPVVFRGKLSPELAFDEFLAQVRETVIGGISNQDFPFPMMVERLQPPRDASRSPIFQVAFGWDKPRLAEESGSAASGDGVPAGSLALEPFALGQQGSAFDLMLMMLDMGNSLDAALQYNSDLFDESTIKRIVGHFQVLLESIVASPNQKLAELTLLSKDEERRQLIEWNDTEADYPREACLHELFERQVDRVPDSIAVEHEGEKLTYAQLDGRANQLAHHLRELNVGPDALVGICVERSIEMVVGVLGILKAGGAYVPLAPGTPADRLAYMLEESNAPVVLTQSHLLDTLPQHAGQVVCLDSDWETISKHSDSRVSREAQPNNLAYVIFTSGSTGKPKGVQIEHRTVVNFQVSMAEKPGITELDRLLAVTTLTFDISVLELFLPLSVGATIVVVSREAAADGVQLARELAESGATIMQATPATWRLLVEAGWEGNDRIKVLCGGEAMPRDLANQLLDRCGSLWNMYGPTETTIWSAVDKVEVGEGGVPIGYPIANTQLYILDSHMRPVPINVPGDLYIGGDGLARGYLNRPELTAEKFISDPFASDPNQRMYATGDLARYRPDGNIDFLGRSDFQVKIRGFRIELGEIEAILNQHEAVSQAVVMARQTGPAIDDKTLVGYIVAAEEEAPNTSDLRDFLREQLPDYMLPSVFMTMDAFPLNPAGKVDRKALPEPDTSRPELRTEYIAPRDDREEMLAEIWASVLGIEEVGINDNFFELGGASIQSLEIASYVEEQGFEMTPAMIFQYPTIAELGGALTVIEQEVAEPSGNGEPSSAAVAEAPKPAVVADVPVRKCNTLIESIGVYLPPDEVSTKEIIKGCEKKMWFPLEKMTGIKSRRMAGLEEFSIDLARQAVDECFKNSKYTPDDIDLVICTNITRLDAYYVLSIDPNTSMQLKRHFGFKKAVVFDVTNACAGMFTAIGIIESYIASGAIRRGMVVSGELITDITRTAQREIEGFLDPRLACLTVGDAGAAAIIEAASNNDVGFHELEMYTLSKYSRMCIGGLTDKPHGGIVLNVPDPIKHTSVAVDHSVANAKYVFEKSPWSPDQMQQLIMHQTSARSLRDGMRAINKSFGKKICNEKNTINNLAHRGNTATTSHFVAVWDNVFNDRIQSGDNVVFGITGSGQTIGTGVYTFDDLPERMRQVKETGKPVEKIDNGDEGSPLLPRNNVRIRVEAVGTIPQGAVERETLAMCKAAGENCLSNSSYDPTDIGLLVFSGMTRSGYISEPAIATMIGGDLKTNDIIEQETDKKTFAFDVYNGAIATLNACQLAAEMIRAGTCKTAMIVASEFDVNVDVFPDRELDLLETGSALILDQSPDNATGFSHFVFHYLPERYDSRVWTGTYEWKVELEDGKPYCDVKNDPAWEDHCLEKVPAAVEELLAHEGLDISQINVLLPPQIPGEFNGKLADLLKIDRGKMADLSDMGRDLFTSALPLSIQHVQQRQLAKPGDIGLVINVAAGIQIGCAIYYF